MAPRTTTDDTAPEGVVDIITTQPGAVLADVKPSLSHLPDSMDAESYYDLLINSGSLEDIPEELLAQLGEITGSNLIAKEDLVGRMFLLVGYKKRVGEHLNKTTGEYGTYYTFDIRADGVRGNIIIAETGVREVIATLEAQGKQPPWRVKNGLRQSDDWYKEDPKTGKPEKMNGTWYFG